MTFALASDIAVDRLRNEFVETGHVQLAPFLQPEQASALAQALAASRDWREVINSGEKIFELDRDTQASLSRSRRAALDAAVAEAARDRFQFRYESMRVPDDSASRAPASSPLHAFAEFMCSPPVVALLQKVTSQPDVDFADAQATLYRPGDFLTAHDDEVTGKGRRAAYVLGLTEEWRIEWGGLLLFHGADGNVSRGLVPRFNCLNLFSVPQVHSVSLVSPWAGASRLSVTGWLRART